MSNEQLWSLQALSNTVWGFSKLGEEDPALLEAVAKASVMKLPHFNAQVCRGQPTQRGSSARRLHDVAQLTRLAIASSVAKY